MSVLETRVRELHVDVQGSLAGNLRRRSQYEFRYADESTLPVSLIMPAEDREFRDNELFAVMDMNLPEGFLLAQIRERAPKAAPTKMQLLALMGTNGIGWLEYQIPETASAPRARPVSRERLLREGAGAEGRVFAELVDAYLSTGSGLSGVQPKIMVPERASVPVPNLIVKMGGARYPDIAANEFFCLEVARRADLPTASHALSDDGALLVIDRFDLDEGGRRFGFEDIAALLDLRVGGALSDRKYRGSYQDVAEVVTTFSSQAPEDLLQLFQMVALSVLLRNGDAHLKNFAMLYDNTRRWLAPAYDLVTTLAYPYERANGERVLDRTMALKLRRGDGSKEYPRVEDLCRFGEEVCGVKDARSRMTRLRDALEETLTQATHDTRLGSCLKGRPGRIWHETLDAWSRELKRLK
ncbi:MAG: type II toxin-antitoxin system HipA family toxin [Myxococcaceae bacterium]